VSLRRLLIVVLACAFVPVGVAAADRPTIAVYDFAVTGGEADGKAYGDAIADELRAGGDVTVVRSPGVASQNARVDAKTHDADYFVIGAVTVVGTSRSALTQLARTRTGLLMWSAPVIGNGPDGVHGQGAQIRDVVTGDFRRNSFPTLTPPPETPTPSPKPFAAGGNPADLFRVGTPTPQPIAAYAIIAFSGSAAPGDRAFAARAAMENIRRRGSTANALRPDAPVQAPGADACGVTGSAVTMSGTVDLERTVGLTTLPSNTASVTLLIYDCAKRAAVDTALETYFGSPLPTRS
jgi:hypothetical protein